MPEQLRALDWRFLLRQREAPGEADLVVIGFPTRKELKSARETLSPGGEVVCIWQRPRPGGVQLARARLRGAGFGEAHFYWPGPSPDQPEFWLPLDSHAAIDHVFSQRPLHSRKQAALRAAWRVAAASGSVGPVYAVARLTGDPGAATAPADEIGELLPSPEPWVLLTGGSESDNKVVGLSFAGDAPAPLVAKFARVPKADAALEREAELLGQLKRERPELPGVPWLRASGQRAGGRAIVQDAMHGQSLSAALSDSSFAAIAPEVTRWLGSLAGDPAPRPASEWAQRLIADPLEELERDFGRLLPPGLPERFRRALAGLGELPLVWEHRDLGPWNVVVAEDGELGAIDWEDAEPRGLPGLDLVYLLSTASFLIDGALDDVSDVDRIGESYRRLLDPSTARGKVAAACFGEYLSRLGVDANDFRRLRLFCWILQSLIAYRRLPAEATDSTPADSGGSFFIHLAEDELRQIESPR